MNKITTGNIDRTFIDKIIQSLESYRKENDSSGFKIELQKMLPDVRRYLSRRLAAAISKRVIPKGKYKVDDFIDQLYIEAYNHLGKKGKPHAFYPWLFKKADELLEDTIVDEEFDELFFKNIEDYTKGEWEEMEENYSTDGDGDFVMLEELDDISYHQNQYALKDVFIEDKESNMIEKLDEELSEQQLVSHFTIAVDQISLLAQSVIDLDFNHGFDTTEIAMIKGMPESEVIQVIESTKRMVKTSFINRFST